MRQIIAAAVMLLQMAISAAAGGCDIAQPRGEVILVVDGMINACNQGSEIHFDRAMIETLPRHAITTENPWDQGAATYEGFRFGDLMRLVKAGGKVAVAAALNDYRSDIPVEDLDKYGVLLAYKRDGTDLTVRDKGPLFVVFPFSDHPELRTEQRYAQSVWQVNRITLK